MKIIHTSDIHLASPLTSRLPAAKASARSKEIEATFARICRGAENLSAEAVIIAGDLFDSEKISARLLDTVISLITSSSSVTFFYLPGNHEEDALLRSGIKLPENLKIFGEGWTYFKLGDVTFAGLRAIKEDSFEALNLPEGGKNIVVLHGELREYRSEEAIALSECRGKNIDYMALGHYHSYSETKIDKRGVAVYSGTPEGRGFDEAGDAGVVVIDTEEPLRYGFVPFAKRALRIVKLDVDGATMTHQIEEKISSAIAGICDADLVRVVLTGRRGVEFRCDKDILTSKFENRFFYFEIKDETKLDASAEDYIYDKSLKGEFIRLCLAEKGLDERQKELIIRCGLSALAGEIFDE
jgi:DNA repair exonuclease SbcCD nuclease subunit